MGTFAPTKFLNELKDLQHRRLRKKSQFLDFLFNGTLHSSCGNIKEDPASIFLYLDILLTILAPHILSLKYPPLRKKVRKILKLYYLKFEHSCQKTSTEGKFTI